MWTENFQMFKVDFKKAEKLQINICWIIEKAREFQGEKNLFYWLHTSEVMLKILQARLQQYVNRELPDVQASFRKGRGTRDQIANIHWIMEKAREFQKSISFCFIDYAKAFDCMDHNKLENSYKDGNTRPP